MKIKPKKHIMSDWLHICALEILVLGHFWLPGATQDLCGEISAGWRGGERFVSWKKFDPQRKERRVHRVHEDSIYFQKGGISNGRAMPFLQLVSILTCHEFQPCELGGFGGPSPEMKESI